MRIIKRTPTQLILQNRDANLYKFLALIPLLASLGLLFSGLSSPVRYSLSCNRTESNKTNCTITKSYLNGSSINEEIKELKSATIKEYRSGKNINYEVVLQTNVSEVSLLTNADGGSEKLAASVNDFVALPQQSTLQLQATAWGNLISSVFGGLLMAGVCSGAILVVSIKTCTFDKNLNQVVFKEKSFIKKQELRFPLNELLAFRVERANKVELRFPLKAILALDGQRSDKFYKLYEIVLVFKIGESLRLVTGYASQRPADKIVGKIENFLSSKKA